jgi:hypothetical protein
MKCQLIHTTANQRYYKLSEPVFYSKDHVGMIDIVAKIKSKKWNPEYRGKILSQYQNGCNIIVISDATTHIERIAFAGACIDGKYMPLIKIGGEYTMMIHGGWQESIKDDKVYLRWLAKVNNLKWEGIC